MNTRASPLPAPPDRAPYFTVVVLGTPVVLRTMSIHAATKFVRDHISTELQGKMLVALKHSTGNNVGTMLALLRTAPELCELFATVIGLCWADPIQELSTAVPVPLDMPAYGSAVFEELHEAGWSLGHIAAAVVRIIEQVIEQNRIDAETMERATFFLQPRAKANESASLSNATSSAPIGDDGSTN